MARRSVFQGGVAALIVTALAGPAAAQAMRVGELGMMPSRAACLETADKALSAYIAEYGGHATSGDPTDPEEWAIQGWGLRPGTIDVVIICPSLGTRTSAFYMLHASGQDAAEATDVLADRLRRFWERFY